MKEIKKQKQKKKKKKKTQIKVFGYEYECAYIGLCMQANCMHTHAKSCAHKHTFKKSNPENKNTETE